LFCRGLGRWGAGSDDQAGDTRRGHLKELAPINLLLRHDFLLKYLKRVFGTVKMLSETSELLKNHWLEEPHLLSDRIFC
jgi:hypothetical protein